MDKKGEKMGQKMHFFAAKKSVKITHIFSVPKYGKSCRNVKKQQKCQQNFTREFIAEKALKTVILRLV